jgi:hypothetical protein
MHELLVVAPEWLMVSYVLDSCLPSSRVDEIDVSSLELVLRDFVVCLDTGGGAHGDLWGEDGPSLLHQ